MRRVFAFLVLLLVTDLTSALAKEHKGEFALTMQGGGFGNLDDRFFKSLAFVVSGGLEYYPVNRLSAGLQFQFSPKGTFGTPVTLGVGSVSGSGSRRSDRLFQTILFVRPTLTVSSGLKFFALAGISLAKVTRTSDGTVVPLGSDGSEEEGNKVGAKFGAGTWIHLRSNTHLNITAAYDTRPQKLFSAQAGLTFFFNPFLQKTDPPKN